ncbi:hypothetical protein D1AOALGA4SA_5773 [Olavius algarvensis Delta 1 endosymbiont]|nr:hypothetical protein D1AOALGA4SA_5773 [Olavius algarvensis Delta 1 endosymbiont]
MEYWESKSDDGLILYTDPCHPYKNSRNRSHSTKASIPSFQYSIIPLPHAAGFMVQRIISELNQLPARRACSPEGGP